MSDDVFRGRHPSSQRVPTPSVRSQSTRSSRSFNPLGAIATVVELAISAWAGNEDSSSSSSSRAGSLDISALIQARKDKQIPRHFSLYIPPSDSRPDCEPILRTDDLSTVLAQLGARRHSPFANRPASASDLALGGKGKGKHREGQSVQRSTKAWFLDVSSPTWEDMRAIGKLLHLHPLTLEDILLGDREKLELFDRLGYYFLSFKAIKSWDRQDDYSSVVESNVYVVALRDGVCCFNFTDVSEHTDRVRNRLLQVDSGANVSSDWIAHGILDSIVDSFFPFLTNGLEKEVMFIENIVFSPSGFPAASEGRMQDSSDPAEDEKIDPEPPTQLVELSEKALARLEKSHLHPRRSSLLAKFSIPMSFRWRRTSSSRTSRNTSTLQRMARARRMVTSLARLLSSKGEVVAQLRKRLMTPTPGSPNGDSMEVAIHLGDVQDHILTLENSLAHYERMLSQSHPLYISQMQNSVAITKNGTDKAVLYLSAVSIGVVCIQTVIGVFSLNVTVPHNTLDGNRYDMFAVVLSLNILILISYSQLVYYWWRKAKKRKPKPL